MERDAAGRCLPVEIGWFLLIFQPFDSAGRPSHEKPFLVFHDCATYIQPTVRSRKNDLSSAAAYFRSFLERFFVHSRQETFPYFVSNRSC